MSSFSAISLAARAAVCVAFVTSALGQVVLRIDPFKENAVILTARFTCDADLRGPVCNDNIETVTLSYHGDGIADSYKAPDFVLWALQMDAFIFASSHDH